MTPDTLESEIDAAFQRELQDIASGKNVTTPDGKPASTMKERTEMLKAAADWWVAKRTPKAVDSPWGKALMSQPGGAVNGR